MTPAQAAQELLARKKARESFEYWLKYRKAPFKPALHHQLMIAELERFEARKTKNLMFCLPPGSAKSTYGSVEFPVWYMGRNPKNLIIGCANTDELAEVFSRRVRNLVDTVEFRGAFGFGLSTDKTGVGNWVNSSEGEYFAAGIGSAIAGRRGDFGLIDDPVRTREDADSERTREKQWQWYLNDFLTRLKPDAGQLVIMTRWHEDDLGGRILERDGKDWKVVSIPMEAQESDPLGRELGERLWPEWYTEEMVERAKLDTRSWWALYQQSPTSDEGGYFKAEWLHEYDDTPKGLKVYGASDYAVTEGSGDFTEHGIIGVDSSGNLYVLDWWYGQKSADKWIDKKADLIDKWSPSCWFGEAGPIRRSVEPFMMKRLSERGAFCRIEWLPSVADKEARARGIQAIMSMGKVYWPKFAPWKSHVQGSLLRFPAGKYDDSVDVMSLFGRGLKFVNASKKPVVRRIIDPVKSWMAG